MKIFWSWQSDYDRKISHYFVRDALNDAIQALKVSSSLEEPSETDRRTQLHLDHDTKGKPGWVDITVEIFKKIEASAVFVADVTPVVHSDSKKDHEGNETGKRPIMNPNVAIELGYALKALEWENIIPVMNTTYGSVDRMPFDIDRTRRWAITYDLKEGATNAEIKDARKKLAADFAAAIKGYLAAPVSAAPFEGTSPKIAPGLFFEDKEVLAVLRNHPSAQGQEIPFTFPARSYMYLRMIPSVPLAIPLNENMLKNMIGRFSSFGSGLGLIQANAYSYAMSELNHYDNSIDSMTQYFRNGEIWGISSAIIRRGDRKDELWLEAQLVEDLLIVSLEIYAEFMAIHAKVTPPVKVEAGLVAVKGRRLVYSGAILDGLGTMYDPNVIYTATLNDLNKARLWDFAKNFAVKMHNNSGVPRRPGLFNRW
jgi:hypothetical protein